MGKADRQARLADPGDQGPGGGNPPGGVELHSFELHVAELLAVRLAGSEFHERWSQLKG